MKDPSALVRPITRPRWTIGLHPPEPVIGEFLSNTETGRLEQWDGQEWQIVAEIFLGGRPPFSANEARQLAPAGFGGVGGGGRGGGVSGPPTDQGGGVTVNPITTPGAPQGYLNSLQGAQVGPVIAVPGTPAFNYMAGTAGGFGSIPQPGVPITFPAVWAGGCGMAARVVQPVATDFTLDLLSDGVSFLTLRTTQAGAIDAFVGNSRLLTQGNIGGGSHTISMRVTTNNANNATMSYAYGYVAVAG